MDSHPTTTAQDGDSDHLVFPEDARVPPEKDATFNSASPTRSDSSSWSPLHNLSQITCDAATREAILDEVQGLDDETIFRYVLYACFGTWRDEETHYLVISRDVLAWIGENNRSFRGEGGRVIGERVLGHIQRVFPNLKILPYKPKRYCRQIIHDGLPSDLKQTVTKDLRRPAGKCKRRVYVLSGTQYSSKRAVERRQIIRSGLDAVYEDAPSEVAEQNCKRLNDRAPNIFTRHVTKHMDDAYAMVNRMVISFELSTKTQAGKTEEEINELRQNLESGLRRYYLAVLRAIEGQAKPFYRPSRKGKTDRVFGLNRSLLNLPKRVRAILCEGLYEIDLKSAHLLIAAWLWDAEKPLSWLSEPKNSIWDELIEHYEPLFKEQGCQTPTNGEKLYSDVKAVLKKAVYSTVYGMAASSIQDLVTKRLRDVLGPRAGAHFRSHWMIKELLTKRDEKLRELSAKTSERGPTGIQINISPNNESGENYNSGVDSKSAMATLAQAYEQAMMSVVLDLEADRDARDSQNNFRVVLWLHDGVYVQMRSPKARMKDLKHRLKKKCRELASFANKENPLPAFFEIAEVEAPEIPDAPRQEIGSCQVRGSEHRPGPATRSEAGSSVHSERARELRKADRPASGHPLSISRSTSGQDGRNEVVDRHRVDSSVCASVDRDRPQD